MNYTPKFLVLRLDNTLLDRVDSRIENKKGKKEGIEPTIENVMSIALDRLDNLRGVFDLFDGKGKGLEALVVFPNIALSILFS
ncbi:MAG: hypothetical protein KIT45_14815 [Fimbriimonadia bacterium]|nr:hypothetical protein [Fimbriimonadia bacterium]